MHTFINDLERATGTHLYGRRMYEVMVAWETLSLAAQPPFILDFAKMWRGAEKVVYSRKLETASTARTRIERDFNPETIRQMKARANRNLSVAGPTSPPTHLRQG